MKENKMHIPLSRKLTTTIIKKGTDFTDEVSSAIKEQGITLQQFNALRILRGRNGKPASLQDVSKDMIHANSNTTRVIDKLVTKKLVKRVQCPSDRRQIEITITQEGLNLLTILDHQVDEKESEITQNLNDEEKKRLIALLMKL
ncbi:transcriptional regulator [Nonlabens sp. MIC269]|uniref:MarR family winged helix-turn-helix transcriptional regulator n=1 Tax=Nonlabens TaxID=363408 RepID=UPI00071EAA7E|nr:MULTISPECIES: MarR family transcriptional regulator [Nonlabens]ALM20346.1 transcriptional regulator [Nonlabens sp. MIC269]ARN70592.1 MarR family transcriptional regulator [Nonlabens tegetincola]MEE2800739.1 MarR family transcriptional regulator [Bacteroidota bacterium]PQJ19452.1 MarR family transcriptional regulator [Nonlabens tegetincola]